VPLARLVADEQREARALALRLARRLLVRPAAA